MQLRQIIYITILTIASFRFCYGQDNCDPCKEGLQYKQQFDHWFTNLYGTWNPSMYINRQNGEAVAIRDNYALRINFLKHDPARMHGYARINYLRAVRWMPDKNEVYNVVVTQLNPVGYRGDSRHPTSIIVAGGYYPNKNGPNGEADDMMGHIDGGSSGSFISTNGKFEAAAFSAALNHNSYSNGEIIGWVAEFRYNCNSLSIGGEESEGEVLTSHIPLNHIICWIPVRKGHLSTGLNYSYLSGAVKINIDYANTFWNSYYKGDAYWNPHSSTELFNEPMPLQLNQGASPVPHDLLHQLNCEHSVDIVPFGIFQKKHNITLPASGELISEEYPGINTITFGAGLHTTMGNRWVQFNPSLVIKPGAVVFMNACEIQFNRLCVIERGGRLIIYPNSRDEPIDLGTMKFYPSNGYIDIRG